ncbi:hypothetical protein, partial [Candidatus Skiveiella danica]|uniref:hypothetical protein n=1 Tax=Candidatus Skiveiella danica TaxID=3386177 RepID=UPI0039B8D489
MPAFHAQRVLAAQAVGQGLRGPDVGHRQVQVRSAAGQSLQVLRGAQGHDHGAAVEVLHAQVHQRGHTRSVTHQAGAQGEAVAHAQAQVGGQLAADDGL